MSATVYRFFIQQFIRSAGREIKRKARRIESQHCCELWRDILFSRTPINLIAPKIGSELYTNLEISAPAGSTRLYLHRFPWRRVFSQAVT